MKKSLLLIDGHALAYRYYFALERSGMKTADGRPIWAVFGFFKCMFDLLQETKVNPDLIAVTFDVARVTFRCDLYPEYKANRESMPADMHDQLDDIIEGLKAFNIPIYTKAGFEADDVIGTIAERAKSQDIKVMILTGDRDSFQLVDDENDVAVIMPSKGEIVTYNREKVFERMGVYPEQVVDLKALAGDTSDNIPGIRGIGDKTAAKLLSQYQTLEGIYEHVDEVSGKALKQKLIDGKADPRDRDGALFRDVHHELMRRLDDKVRAGLASRNAPDGAGTVDMPGYDMAAHPALRLQRLLEVYRVAGAEETSCREIAGLVGDICGEYAAADRCRREAYAVYRDGVPLFCVPEIKRPGIDGKSHAAVHGPDSCYCACALNYSGKHLLSELNWDQR